MAPPKEEMIDTFRNNLYNCVLEDSSTGVGTVTGIYVDVVQEFQFLNKKPLNLKLEVDGFQLTGRVFKVGTGIKIVIDHTPLKDKYNAHYNVSAVGDQNRGIRTWLDFKLLPSTESTTSFMCPDLLEKSKGYVNSNGAFKIKVQINLIHIANVHEAYQFPRAFRLDAFFTRKDYFESVVFSCVVESTKRNLAHLKQNPAWDSIISKKLFWQMEEKEFFHVLWQSLGRNMILWDIVWTGSLKFLFDLLKKPPQGLTVFLRRKHRLFTLSGSVDDMLEKVEKLEHVTILQPELNLAGFESLERELLLKGCVILQCIYVSNAWENIKLDIETAEAHEPDIPPPAEARETLIPPPAVAREAGIPLPVAREAGIPLPVAHEAGIPPPVAREPVLPHPFQPGEEGYMKVVDDVATRHTDILGSVLDLGDAYRNAFKGIYSSHPPNQYKSKLKEVISQFHAKAQLIVSFYFREDENLEKDEDKDFYTWKYIPNKEERTMIKSRESREEAKKVGYKGEEFVFSFLQDQYIDDHDIEVKWCNSEKESGLPYDLAVWNVSEDRYLYVEVKASSVLNREWFFLTHEELNWARYYRDQYILFYVSVDLKKPPNKQCKVIKMYRDPAYNPDLELSMVDVSKFRS